MDADVFAPDSNPALAGQAAKGGWRRWQVVLPVVLVLAIAGTLLRRSLASARVQPAPAVRVVPVVAVPARQGDLPVNLSGLGTVVPTDAVTIRTRVDGQLMSVNFREGQLVRKGDLLMQVDPRPFQVALLQAEGQSAKDMAARKNARKVDSVLKKIK